MQCSIIFSLGFFLSLFVSYHFSRESSDGIVVFPYLAGFLLGTCIVFSFLVYNDLGYC